MASSTGSSSDTGLAAEEVARIKDEVRRAAWDHLNAVNATTALGHYTEDAVLASNGLLYRSLAAAAPEIEGFYSSLREVHVAEWEEMLVDVVSAGAALVTAVFHWSSTDKSDATIDLKGVWSALYVRQNGQWKIQARHESFGPAEDWVAGMGTLGAA